MAADTWMALGIIGSVFIALTVAWIGEGMD